MASRPPRQGQPSNRVRLLTSELIAEGAQRKAREAAEEDRRMMAAMRPPRPSMLPPRNPIRITSAPIGTDWGIPAFSAERRAEILRAQEAHRANRFRYAMEAAGGVGKWADVKAGPRRLALPLGSTNWTSQSGWHAPAQSQTRLSPQAQSALAVMATTKLSPEAAAHVRKLSRSGDLPFPLVEASPGAARSQHMLAWSGALMEYDYLADWLQAHPFAIDDHAAVYDVAECLIRPRAVLTTAHHPAPTFLNGLKGLWKTAQMLPEYSDTLRDLMYADFEAEVGFGDPLQLERRSERARRDFAQIQNHMDLEKPAYKGDIANGIYDFSSELLQLAPGIALSALFRNPAPLRLWSTAQGVATTYGKYRGRDGGRRESLAGTILESVVDMSVDQAMGGMGIGRAIEKLFPPGLKRKLADWAVNHFVVDQLKAHGKDVVDYTIANPDRTLQDYLNSRWQRTSQTALMTTFNTAFGAATDAEFLTDLERRARPSRTRLRDPQGFADLLNLLGRDTIDEIYIPGTAVQRYLDSDHGHDRIFWQPYRQQLKEALQNRGDVIIPGADAIAHLSGSKAWDALHPDMRLTPGGSSLRESQKFEADYPLLIQQSAKSLREKIEVAAEAELPRRQLYEAHVTRMTENGVPLDVAHRYAELRTAMTEAAAERSDRRLTEQDASAVVALPRGTSTDFARDEALVAAFNGHDPGSLIRTAASAQLESLRTEAARPDASPEAVRDWQTIVQFFGANGQSLEPDGVLPRAARKLWEREVERYIIKGRAPAPELSDAFSAFHGWISGVFRSAERSSVPVSPEVREVMARLSASDQAIENARATQHRQPLFGDGAGEHMTSAERASYAKLTSGSTSAAKATALKAALKPVRLRRTRAYRRQWNKLRKQVSRQASDRPEVRMLAAFDDGTRLNADLLAGRYGSEVGQALERYASSGGWHPDVLAERFGFGSGDEMIGALSATAQQGRLRADGKPLLDTLIDAETDALMRVRHGDLIADGSIERTAQTLVHSDADGERIGFELRILSRGEGGSRLAREMPVDHEQAKMWAAQQVSKGLVFRHADQHEVQRFERSARNEARLAEEAFRTGDLEGAVHHKQAELLNNALVGAAARAAEEARLMITELTRIEGIGR